MKYLNKILYLVGVFSIIYILIWLYKNNLTIALFRYQA